MRPTLHRVLGTAAISLLLALPAVATPPPKRGVKFPEEFMQRLRTDPRAFTTRRALQPLVQRILANRSALRGGRMTLAAARALGGISVRGTRAIPVLTAKYANSGADPYPVADLQKELFDGPWPTGTMTQYYQEISYGRFSVTGTVFPWKKLSKNDVHYEGPAGCKGLCNAAKVGEFLKETLDANDAAIDFASFDNDGPDGLPNSGDDDGFVDFVAFVHPEAGGECGAQAIWSHRWAYSGWMGTDYTTNDARHGGGKVKIDDYVVQPARACDGVTMIQIGVFAHEFGHAFGLPDLYDTDDDNGESAGVGAWCLMGAGSWGGDDNSPERPTHMSIWAKEYLGWLSPDDVTSDLAGESIPDVESHSKGYRLPISTTQHYLVEMRAKKLFDEKIPSAGLLVWRVNQTVLDAGMANNRVNADETNPGLEVVEADGRTDLDDNANRADAGDPFPGEANATRFDNATTPASIGSAALCEISATADTGKATLQVSSGTCGEDVGNGNGNSGGCASLAANPQAAEGSVLASWGLLPLTVGVAWLPRGRRWWRDRRRF